VDVEVAGDDDSLGVVDEGGDQVIELGQEGEDGEGGRAVEKKELEPFMVNDMNCGIFII